VASKTKQEILDFIDTLIEEGERLRKTARPPLMLVKEPPKDNWVPRIRTLAFLLGRKAGPWTYQLNRVPTDSRAETVNEFLGTLRAVREAVDSGLLIEIEDMVLAEAIGDLLEQANHLADKGYHLAAGVLGRAVLEGHLRKWCERTGCLPRGRPTLNDLNQALYKGRHLNKLEMQQATALTTVGNHCAHNVQPPLEPGRVGVFLRDVREFVVRNPIS